MGCGEKLKQLRGKKTRQKVAEDLGISVSALRKYEDEDRTPRDEIKVKIAQYYKRSVGNIFFTT